MLFGAGNRWTECHTVVEMSVEITFPTWGQAEESFDRKVIPSAGSLCNYIIFIEL